MKIEATLVQGLLVGGGLVIIEKLVGAIEGAIADKEPEFVKKWNLFYLAFALGLIAFGGKVHKLLPAVGGVMVVLWFAGIIRPYVDNMGGE